LRRLEAIRDIAETLASSKNRIMLDSSNLMFDSLSQEIQDMYDPHQLVLIPSSTSTSPSPTTAGEDYRSLYTKLAIEYADTDDIVEASQ
jgi:hypothetical protein